jgi:thioredoxin 1
MSEDKELEKIKKKMLRRMLDPEKPVSIWDQGKVIELNQANFFELLVKTEKLIVIDFWADWCAPCKMMSPIIHSLAKQYQGKVGFGKLNTDSNPVLATRYRVTSIPNFIFFKNGNPVDQVIGAVGKQTMDTVIKKNL